MPVILTEGTQIRTYKFQKLRNVKYKHTHQQQTQRISSTCLGPIRLKLGMTVTAVETTCLNLRPLHLPLRLLHRLRLSMPLPVRRGSRKSFESHTDASGGGRELGLRFAFQSVASDANGRGRRSLTGERLYG